MKTEHDEGAGPGEKDISLWQKILFVLPALFLTLCILEAGLRTAGFVTLFLQEQQNLRSIKQKGAYRIVCIGESTTLGQYPQLLEKDLNERNIGVRFSVIDKGLVSATTAEIVSNVGSYLTECRPDMVIAMMGIGDRSGKVSHDASTTPRTPFILSLRTYKMAVFLWDRFLNQVRMQFAKPREGPPSVPSGLTAPVGSRAEVVPTGGPTEKAAGSDPPTESSWIALGEKYRMQREFPQAEDAYRKALELNPENDGVYLELGRLFRDQHRCLDAEHSLKKALALNPKSDGAYTELGRSYSCQEKISEAEGAYMKAIELNPNSAGGHTDLGQFYMDTGKFSQAEAEISKAIELNPGGDNSYHVLGWLYLKQKKFPEAEDAYKKIIEHNPYGIVYYDELGQIYREQGKFSQVEDLFKKGIAFNPGNERLLGAISLLYEEMGKSALATDYAARLDAPGLRTCNPVTAQNYRKLKEILEAKGVKLVCVAYPDRSVKPLKEIFQDDKDVMFVSNEKTFKEAVRREGYGAYFVDAAGGDFGHCTQKGNRLLARNIADVILREVFNEKP